MPKIEAWKCPHTSQLFEEEKVYRTHLKTLSRQRLAQRKWQKIRNSVNDIVAGAQNVSSCQELVDYIIDHEEAFMIYGTFNDSRGAEQLHEAMEKGWKITFPKLVTLKIDTKWRPEVSNSHNCPRDGYTNWSGRNTNGRNARHYPGWYGRITASYDKKDMHLVITKSNKKIIKIEAPSLSDLGGGFGSNHSLCGICTGSGGGGAQNNSYEVSLFQSDFPKMAKLATFAVLTDKSGASQFEELDKLGFGNYESEVTK